MAAIATLCNEHRVPLVPRGAGTGYTGGSVPTRGGVVLSLERMNRILEIDEANLLAIVEPNVITGDLQDAVEKVGLFYPPDPASLRLCALGGNVAECAGGPRAFKYGTTKRYVLGLEAVLPTGEIVRTGGKTVKNVVGYDLTQLLVGSEGTLAIVTKIILRLVPRPAFQATLRATFGTIEAAVAAVVNITRARVVPAALELIDGESLEAVAQNLGVRSLAPAGTAALLLLEVDGVPAAVEEEASRVEQACRDAGATEVLRARDEAERAELWRVRREMSLSLKMVAALKFNHDVVVPKGRIPQLFELVGAAAPRIPAAHSVVRPCRRRQYPRQLHGRSRATPTKSRGPGPPSRCCSPGWSRSKARSAASTASASAKAPFLLDRVVGRRDRADAAGEGGVRSERDSESGKDLPLTRAGSTARGLAVRGPQSENSVSSTRP